MSAKTSNPTPSNQWLTNKRLICFGLIAAATIYVLLQPRLEQWTGMDLPDIVQRDEPNKANQDNVKDGGEFRIDSGGLEKDDKVNSNDGGKSFRLKSVGRDSFESPEGLLYTPSKREHRIEHVMLHAKDDPKRNGAHGVFDGNTQDEVLAVLDEAYKLIKSKDRSVRKQGPDEFDRFEYTIDMSNRIGYVGGEQGGKRNHPATKRLKLVLDGNRVITAYPTWPPGRR